MNAERLMAYYQQIADTPDAIAQLRRFILDLAVRGKLMPQDANDEPASDLLKRSKKDRSHSSLKASRTDKNETAKPEHDLPASWLWVRIGDHLELINGMAFKPTDWKQDGIKIVRIQNLNRLDATFNYCDPKTVRDRFFITDGAFLISWSGTPGTSFGAFIWERGEAVLNQHIFRCDFRLNAFDPLYLRLAINGRLDEMIAKAHGGVGLQHITKGKLEALLIALPPLSEQHRIVAKVDELMGLCDRLETVRAGREAVRDRLAAASLARLNTPDPETFQADARFALDALPALTTRPDQIKALRQTILDLAVRGKLVPQDASDEPASELLKRIAKEKGQQVNQGKAKRQDPLPEIDLNQVPFELPANWTWGRFPEVGIFGRGKSKHRPRNDPALFDGGEHLMIQTGDVARSHGVIETHTSKYNDFGLSQSFKWPKGTLCITIAANIADSGILGFDACFPDSVVGFIPASMFENARYFEYFVRTAKANLMEFAPATAQKNINLEILTQVLIPLPPLAEQCRIVAKVDALMALCDRLEASLTAAAATRRRLLDALLAEALAPYEARELEAAE